jgi:serine/threonine-protein kinase
MTHPERLGKYQITGVLGEGAMGVVYRGFDPDIRRVVALKTIRRQGGDGAQAVAQSAARFRNEAQAAGRLLHPGIVGVYDFGDDGHVAFIAMEYVPGHTLSHYLAQKVHFSEADVASVATQLLDALAHAHEHAVWHRDIKPSNVIMTQSGRIKIADFGIARTDTTGLTMTNSVLGTPMYMAPEQFLGQTIDHRVDLYGAGVVLYQMLAGRPPFVGPHEALMYKVVHEVPQPPSAVEGAAHGSRFDAVVAIALAKDPRDRFASALAFREAVAAALAQPVAAAVSQETVGALPVATEFAPTVRIAGAPATGSTPTHWDAAVLAQMESTLARHVGPLARVLVLRAARECHDLPALQARLAEQITNPLAREAFLGQASRSGSRSATGGTGGSAGRSATPAPHAPTAGRSAGGSLVSDAVLEQAQHLLAQHVGPIARVVVKRAADRTRERGPLFQMLAEAAPEPMRQRLIAELSKLA